MIDPAAEILTPTLSLVSTKRVPNVFPTVEVPYRLAIVGEAPGSDEEAHGIPFVGASGRLLDSILASVGAMRSACFIGNVCKYRPPGNDISEFGWDDPRVQEGLNELKHELSQFKPNCVLCLGNTPLRALSGEPYGERDSGRSVGDYRGSIQYSREFNTKFVGAYHPAYILREYVNWPLLRLDAQRARVEADTPTLSLPVRNFDLDLSASEIVRRLDTWPTGLPASIDIEGGLNGWICLSVISSPDSGFIIAFGKHTDSEQAEIYKAVSRFLYNISIPKVLQNSLYEGFVLGYGFNMLVRNVKEDTMLKGWEIYPELPKGLDTQASIWTRQPQWKHLIAYSKKEQKKRALAGVSPDQAIRDKHLACCIDSAVTLEISNAQNGALSQDALRHYHFNMELLNPLLYMELKGIKYDKATAERELGQVQVALAETATRIENRILPMQFTKKDFTNRIRGEKGSLSSQRLAKVLYEQKGFPVQKKGRGPDAKVSTDVEALLNLGRKYPNDPFIADILLHRKLESIQETLEVQTDPDGRVRCGYNLVGTETGRLTCYTSPTGSGANLQTITKKLRKLYTADDDKWFFQCDLAGADGWTVAAYCLRHGDPTMWDDYQNGLKPAKIIALMYEHGSQATICSRDELKERCRSVDQDGWLYFSCKAIQHGSNYGMQEKTVSTTILKNSYKFFGTPIFVEPNVCASLQRLYFVRYPGLYQWHEWAKRQVLDGHNLKGASGHTRIFFGRRKSYDPKHKTVCADHDTWKEFLADEPQENTGYANNLALHRLWHDPENRIDGKKLIVEPLHTVHDAVLGQFPKSQTEFALRKIRSWYQNPIQIANSILTIPFEGAYGPSWGELGTKYGGGEI